LAILQKLQIVFNPSIVLGQTTTTTTTTIQDAHDDALLLDRTTTTIFTRPLLQEWELWGPLIICLQLAITMSYLAPEHQGISLFTFLFCLVWFGAFCITMNAKLLGGRVTFFQNVCILGYCLAPQCLASVACCLGTISRWWIVKSGILLFSLLWSILGK
jgi:Yip1 domain